MRPRLAGRQTRDRALRFASRRRGSLTGLVGVSLAGFRFLEPRRRIATGRIELSPVWVGLRRLVRLATRLVSRQRRLSVLELTLETLLGLGHRTTTKAEEEETTGGPTQRPPRNRFRESDDRLPVRPRGREVWRPSFLTASFRFKPIASAPRPVSGATELCRDTPAMRELRENLRISRKPRQDDAPHRHQLSEGGRLWPP